MPLIRCPECGGDIATTAKRCPSCDSKVVIIGGREISSYSFVEKLAGVVLLVIASLLVSWILVSGLEWLVSSSRLAASYVNAIYWWMFFGITFLVIIEFFKKLGEGELNG